jgi:hypothetical protein
MPLVSRMEELPKLKLKNVVHWYSSDTIIIFFVPLLYLFYLRSLNSTVFAQLLQQYTEFLNSHKKNGRQQETDECTGIYSIPSVLERSNTAHILELGAAGISYDWWVVTCTYNMVLYIY